MGVMMNSGYVTDLEKIQLKFCLTYFGEEFAPKSNANKAFTVEQRLCIALCYYAMGTFQRQVGDSEGVSQPSMHRIITQVSKVLALHCNDIISFSTDPDVFKAVSDGFYEFKGSKSIL